jgi:hypothetical protein
MGGLGIPSVLAQVDSERIDFIHKVLNCSEDDCLNSAYCSLFALIKEQLSMSDFPL